MLRIVLTSALLLISPAAQAQEKPEATMYRVPFCGC
jgi:hypothetical protein